MDVPALVKDLARCGSAALGLHDCDTSLLYWLTNPKRRQVVLLAGCHEQDPRIYGFNINGADCYRIVRDFADHLEILRSVTAS